MPSSRQVAASFQQPRGIDGYREHFLSTHVGREGTADIKILSSNEKPNDFEWERKYVVLRDGIVYVCDSKGDSLKEVVRISLVSYVKTVQSWNSKTIIKVSTKARNFFLDAQTESELREWLFSFHTAVMVHIIGSGERDMLSSSLGQLDLATPNPENMTNRSQSGEFLETAGASGRFWAQSFGSNPTRSRGMTFAGGSIGSSNGTGDVSTLPSNFPTVDRYGSFGAGSNGNGNEHSNGFDYSNNDLVSQPTRDFSAPISPNCRRMSSSPNAFGSPSGWQIGTPMAESSASPKNRMSPQESSARTLNSPALAQSYSPNGLSITSPKRRGSSFSVMTESTKRVSDPPVRAGRSPSLLASSPGTESTVSSKTASVSPFQQQFVARRNSASPEFSSPTSRVSLLHEALHSDSFSEDVEALPPSATRSNLTSGHIGDCTNTISSEKLSAKASSSLADTLASGDGSLELGGVEAANHTPIPTTSPTAASMLQPTPAAAPIRSKYVPPHLRGGTIEAEPDVFEAFEEEETESLDFSFFQSRSGRGTGELRGSEQGQSFQRRSSNRSTSSGDFDDGMFDMEGSGNGYSGGRVMSNSNDFGTDNEELDSQNRDAEVDHGHPLYGRCAEQGCRSTMEDFDVTIPSLSGREIGFYGVFDGHCGTRVAKLASEKLHLYSAEHDQMFENWPHGAVEAISEAFERVEREFIEMATAEPDNLMQDGTCALVAIVHYPFVGAPKADGIAVANLGDSRVILYDGGVVSALSQEHSPARPDEKERIESAGGWVTIEREMLIEKLHRMDLNDPMIRERASRQFNYVEISRVNGELAVSRALGDIDYKAPRQDNYSWFFPQEHPAFGEKQFTFNENLVGSTPEWKTIELPPRERSSEEVTEDHSAKADGIFEVDSEESVSLDAAPKQGATSVDYRSFLIIACDGLWDALSNQEAVDICLCAKSAQEASVLLANAALRMGSSDNVSVLVVSLSEGTFPCPRPVQAPSDT